MDISTIIYNHFKNESIETIREVYFLHIKYERSYVFLFKAILEIKNKYPKAYDFVAEYRKWVLNEIYKLIVKIKENLTIVDAFLLIFIIDGQVLDRVNVDYTENAEIKLNYFFRCIELI
ncbi:hypothetical protein [Acinetobacter seifertii]|uniref:hypothetical protein n=1 Tax=Acinetobacter seifertii TaxID=1530123 RepID=UPI0032B4BBF1